MYTILWNGDAGSEGIYRAGEMVMSAYEVNRLGYRWESFIGASAEKVEGWYLLLVKRRK